MLKVSSVFSNRPPGGEGGAMKSRRRGERGARFARLTFCGAPTAAGTVEIGDSELFPPLPQL